MSSVFFLYKPIIPFLVLDCIKVVADTFETLLLSQVVELTGGALVGPGPADGAITLSTAWRARPIGVLQRFTCILSVPVLEADPTKGTADPMTVSRSAYSFRVDSLLPTLVAAKSVLAVNLCPVKEDVFEHPVSHILRFQHIDVGVFDPPFRVADPRPLGILLIPITLVNLAPTLGRGGPTAVQTLKSRVGRTSPRNLPAPESDRLNPGGD